MKSSIFDISESPASKQIIPVSHLKHCLGPILSLCKTDSGFLLSTMPCIALLFCDRLKMNFMLFLSSRRKLRKKIPKLAAVAKFCDLKLRIPCFTRLFNHQLMLVL